MPPTRAPASMRERDRSPPDAAAGWYPRQYVYRNTPRRQWRQLCFVHRCVAPSNSRTLESHAANPASRLPRPAFVSSLDAWESDGVANVLPRLPRNSPPSVRRTLSYPCGSQPPALLTRATPSRLCQKKYLGDDAWPPSRQLKPSPADRRRAQS